MVLPFSAGLGALAAALYASNGRYEQAAFAFVLMLGLGALLAFSKTEWVVAQGPTADERQRAINDTAMKVAYCAVVSVGVMGFVYEIANDTYGAFGIICTVGGFAHGVALAILRRRV